MSLSQLRNQLSHIPALGATAGTLEQFGHVKDTYTNLTENIVKTYSISHKALPYTLVMSS